MILRQFYIILLVCVIAFTGWGCKGKKKGPDKQEGASLIKQAVNKIESIDLAKEILRPKPYEFTLPRDPFRPLFGKESSVIHEGSGLLDESEIKLSGILFMESKPLALLELPSLGVEMFRQDARIGAYTVKRIEPERVILEKEGRSIILEMVD